ncbi:phosphotransferase [Mycoplasma elephantis]|uniref:phosphotransferase n=1 Tax=Mycoplasma elephantis TaxID=114882 RepID=UPI000483C3DD|nr:phosphotransferase [Mycoplasma elephantis]
MNNFDFLDKKIKNISLEYKGFHNTTYIGFLDNVKVQIRIPNNKIVNHEIEEKFLKTVDDVIYYKNGILVRKWFDGQTLEKVKLNSRIINNLINEVKKLNELKINLPKVDFYYYGTGNKKYNDLISKYKNTFNDVCHMDLNKKNVLVNEDNEVKIIDFEWVRKSNKAFDIVCLYKNFGIKKNILINKFNLSKKEFDDFLYIENEFKNMAYISTYSKEIERILNEDKKITIFNNLAIKKKVKNSFNYLLDESYFNMFKFAQNIIFENDSYIISEKINNKIVNLKSKKWLIKIAKIIKNVHKIKKCEHLFKLYDLINYYLNNNKFIMNYLLIIFDEIKINKIMKWIKNIKPDSLCHNDLNSSNILIDVNDNVRLIDFEYASLNNHYFDIAYFCSNLMLDEKQEKLFLEAYGNYDEDEYIKYKIIVNFYCLIWSIYNEDDFNIQINIKYINENYDKLNKN